MQIQDWGEERFVNYLETQFPSRDPIVGIGDDCAVIPRENGLSLLVTTDALVEGIHFIKDQISPENLGYKSIAVSVSDIAAMGGTPEYAFLSIAIPPTVECAWLKSVIQGIKEACMKWNLQLLGGDTIGSKRDIFINVTLTGSAPHAHIKYRHQAKPGDIICVNGYLGDSGGGLEALRTQVSPTEEIHHLIHRHFHPEPSVEEGVWIAAQNGVGAMMDLSDGLDCDLQHLIKSSQYGALVELSKLPISEPLLRAGAEYNWDVTKLALTGGEDYCLLMTISQDASASIQRLFQEKFGHPLYPIGRITDQPAQIIYHKNGEPAKMHIHRFDHFQ
jgi:thiamine-monophosphate kinase